MDPIAVADTWHVRLIRPADRRVCGAGVLVTDRHVLTCAHVVAEALGCDPGGSRPDGIVMVDFPALPGQAGSLARVAPDGWAHQRSDEGGDLAVLVFDGGAVRGAFPPRLSRCGVPGRRRVKVFGHPEQFEGGLWAAGLLIGAGGQSSEWIQLDGEATGPPIVRGYSGAGVIDEATGAVIGCIVACTTAPEHSALAGIAWMIPLETVARYWPPLAGFLEEEAAHASAGIEIIEPAVDEQRLALSLFAIGLIRDRRSRDLCISQLGRRLYQPLPMHRYDGDIDDVRALARCCLTVPGLMPELLAILAQAAEASPAVMELTELAAALIPAPLLEREERNQLYSLLGTLRLDGMELLYRESVGALGKPLRGRRGHLPTIVQQLEDASYGPHGGPPLLYFVRSVADRVPPETRTALRAWLAAVADRLHIPADPVIVPAAVPGESAQGTAQSHYLVTDLSQDLLDPDRYRVTIWLQAGPDHEQVIGGGDDELVRLGDVPAQLDAALSNLSPDMIGQRRSRTFEFILPRHLLSLPVDQWRIGPEEMPYRFSMSWPVIVRSQDRLRDQRMQQYWHSKWRWLRENSERAAEDAVHWLDNRAPHTAEGILSLLVQDDPPVCVIFREPPAASTDPGRDVLMAALFGGVPVMIWCRDSDHAELAEREIERLLTGGALAELPERVRLLRNQAIQVEDHAGHPGLSLTLLWDEADRIPGAYRQH